MTLVPKPESSIRSLIAAKVVFSGPQKTIASFSGTRLTRILINSSSLNKLSIVSTQAVQVMSGTPKTALFISLIETDSI